MLQGVGWWRTGHGICLGDGGVSSGRSGMDYHLGSVGWGIIWEEWDGHHLGSVRWMEYHLGGVGWSIIWEV